MRENNNNLYMAYIDAESKIGRTRARYDGAVKCNDIDTCNILTGVLLDNYNRLHEAAADLIEYQRIALEEAEALSNHDTSGGDAA